jgi:hypothetical protein
MAAPQIIYTVIDDSGERGTTSINLPTGFSIAQIGEFGAAMATLLDAILSGKVESAEFCVSVDVSALINNLAGLNGDVEEIGAFQFETVGGFPVYCNIPGILETVVAAGSDDIDQSDVDVAAFITAMETGIVVTGDTVSPTDVGEDSINNTVYARERFRASGKRG